MQPTKLRGWHPVLSAASPREDLEGDGPPVEAIRALVKKMDTAVKDYQSSEDAISGYSPISEWDIIEIHIRNWISDWLPAHDAALRASASPNTDAAKETGK